MSSAPSVSYSITVRLEVPAGGQAVSQLTTAVESAGGSVTGVRAAVAELNYAASPLAGASWLGKTKWGAAAPRCRDVDDIRFGRTWPHLTTACVRGRRGRCVQHPDRPPEQANDEEAMDLATSRTY